MRPRAAVLRAGFTFIEILVVLVIVALGTALVAWTIRDPAETRLEQEAARLVALLEGARAEARAGSYVVAWVPTAEPGQPAGFRFEGLPPSSGLPSNWLDDRTRAEVVDSARIVLGPDAILPPQRVVLSIGERHLEIGSDGISAFAVIAPTEQPG